MTTITHEQFEAAVQSFMDSDAGDWAGDLRAAFAAVGITIAEPEPLEAMFKMAEEAFLAVRYKIDHCPSFTAGYIAALQYAAKAAEEAEKSTHPVQVILKKLGAK